MKGHVLPFELRGKAELGGFRAVLGKGLEFRQLDGGGLGERSMNMNYGTQSKGETFSIASRYLTESSLTETKHGSAIGEAIFHHLNPVSPFDIIDSGDLGTTQYHTIMLQAIGQRMATHTQY